MPKLRWLSLSSKKCNLFTFFFEQKNIHNRIFRLNVDKVVDNVDNLLSKELFAHFYNISGPHSYQQVAVD